MSVNWEQYKEEAAKAADEARANVLAEIQKVEDFYKEQFNKAQSAALEARDSDVPLGETAEAYAARIAAVPGAFNDRAQSAVQVVNTPRLEASIAASNVAKSATVPSGTAAPAAPVQAPVITPAPVSDQQTPPDSPPLAQQVAPEPVVTPEAQPDQPTPEPEEQKAEVTPEPEATPVVEEPAVETQPEAEPVVEAPAEETPAAA